MRELFDLSEKYGFKAPLVDAPESLDLKVYLRLCGALSVSQTTWGTEASEVKTIAGSGATLTVTEDS